MSKGIRKNGSYSGIVFGKGHIPWNKGISKNLNLLWKGSKHTEETRLKISLAKRGKSLSDAHKKAISEATKGLNNWTLGVKNPSHSMFMMGKKFRYIEDRTKLGKNEKKHLDSQYKVWMLDVKNRDNWKCRIADTSCKGRLESHHILNWLDYPELRYDINNGITLCLTHHPRGRKAEREFAPIFQELIYLQF